MFESNSFKEFYVEYSEKNSISQPAFTYSKLTIETLEQSVKYVQS